MKKYTIVIMVIGDISGEKAKFIYIRLPVVNFYLYDIG